MIEKRKSLFDEIIGVKDTRYNPTAAEQSFNAIAQKVDSKKNEQPTVTSPNIWDEVITEIKTKTIPADAGITEIPNLYELVLDSNNFAVDASKLANTNYIHNEIVVGPSINYLFNEAAYLAEAKIHIDKTYGGHYSGQYQATSIIIDAGHGTGFNIGNIIKYAKRYGKKDGYNRADILKIIHYATMQLYVHDKENLS